MRPTPITKEEVKQKMDAGEPITFLDARAAKAWDSSEVKIAGAIRMLADEVAQRLEEIPRDRTVVTYCT